MKNKTILYVIIFVFVMAVAVFGYNMLSVNYRDNTDISATKKDTASDFSVTDNNGNTVRLSDFKGKPVVVNFWATWCGPCKSELPAFESVYKKYGDKVQFMMVNMTDGQRETVQGAKDFTEENGFTYPLYFDTELNAAMTYSVYSIPMTLIVDKNGNLVKTRTGTVSEGYLVENIEKVIAEK